MTFEGFLNPRKIDVLVRLENHKVGYQQEKKRRPHQRQRHPGEGLASRLGLLPCAGRGRIHG